LFGVKKGVWPKNPAHTIVAKGPLWEPLEDSDQPVVMGNIPDEHDA